MVRFKSAIYDPNGWSKSDNTQYYFADVNGDQMADKIYWNRNYHPSGHPKGVVKVFLADGTGKFHSAVYNKGGWSDHEDTHFYFADVNGDQKADKIYWNRTNNHSQDGKRNL